MKKLFFIIASIISAVTPSFASDNFDYSYVSVNTDNGYVGYVNPEKPLVYYRTIINGYDSGVGASATVKTNNYPDTSSIFTPDYAGVSGSYAYSSVNDNPYDRTMQSYTATYQHGTGPTQWYAGETWDHKPVIYSYNGPFGMTKTSGYFANVFHIESGSSGLGEGTPVTLNFGYNLEGAISGNSTGYTRTYFGSQVFDISDVQGFSFPDADRAERWLSSHNRGEMLEMYTGDTWQDLDPVLAYDNKNGWGENLGTGAIEKSDDFALNATIGDWLFVEGYFETITELPTASGVATNLENIADFANTMHFLMAPDSDFSGISLVAKSFSPASVVTPEPISSVLFLVGSGLFAVRRFKK